MELSDARKQLAKLLPENLTLRLAEGDFPQFEARVSYVNDDSELVPISGASSGHVGKVIGILFLIIVLIPTVYYGGKWAYDKHQTMRYRTLASFGRQTEDQVIHQVHTFEVCWIFS